ncbi:MAG: hypothetical protein QME94_16920 [Anaerolineae bacterium]|nr:hypothetical protein [Anaerolineae bacterium]
MATPGPLRILEADPWPVTGATTSWTAQPWHHPPLPAEADPLLAYLVALGVRQREPVRALVTRLARAAGTPPPIAPASWCATL